MYERAILLGTASRPAEASSDDAAAEKPFVSWGERRWSRRSQKAAQNACPLPSHHGLDTTEAEALPNTTVLKNIGRGCYRLLPRGARHSPSLSQTSNLPAAW